MHSILSFVAVLAAATPQAPAVSQAAVGPAPAATPEATEGVTSYPASFFAQAKASTALDMVQRLPGFPLDTGDTNKRGFESAAGNVLVDGARPVSKTDALDEILRRIPASQVDRIEVIRGGAPGIDMQGKSILANVVRTKTSALQGLIAYANNHAVADGRNRGGLRLEGSGRIGPGNFEAGARYGEGIDDGVGTGPHLQVNPDGSVRRRSELDGKGNAHQYVVTGAYELPVLGGKLRVNGRGFWDYYHQHELDRITAPVPGGIDTRYIRQDKQQTELGGRYTRNFGDRLQLDLVGLRQTEDYGLTVDGFSAPNGVRFLLDKTTEETIGRAVVKYRQSPSLSLELGAETALNTLDSRTGLLQNGAPIPLPAANVEVEEKRNEAFAKAVWRPNPQWTVEGGLRYETSSITSSGDVRLEKDLHFAKPRLFVTWAPVEGTQVRARYEREVGQLNFDDFVASSSFTSGVVTSGNPDIDPEQAWVSELAVEQRFWKNGSVALTARHSQLTDVVDRAPVFDDPKNVFDAPANIGDGTKDELIVDLTLPLERFGVRGGQLRGQTTWRKSEVTDPTTHVKREISGLRPVEWEGHFTQDLPQWNLNWGVDAFGAWRETYYNFDEVSTDKLKTWVALFVEYKPRPDWTFRGELDNATDRGFRHTRQVYSGPRNANPLAYTDDRDVHATRGIYIRIRKSFG